MIHTIVRQELVEERREIATPAYFKTKFSRLGMICEDGSVVFINHDLIIRWESTSPVFHNEAINDCLDGEIISREEFMTEYKKTLRSIIDAVFFDGLMQ